jgi:23S rRNA (cytidine1920-2'-O)/16S rRNA (cytidine1409-2'-O)-methyltransferase
MEQTHAADLPNLTFDPRPEFAAVDVSFISLTKVLAPLREILTGDFSIVILIKPQFELWKELIKDGGIAPKEHHQTAIRNVLDYAGSIGLSAGDVIESPITGAKSGNIEYLAVLRKQG